MTNENYLDTNATNVGIANFMQSLSSEKVMSMIATAYTQADEMMQKNKRQLNILVFGQTKERTFINILFGENLIINCINKSINECKIKDDLSVFDCFDIDKGLENITSFLNEKMQENSDKQIHIAYFIYTKDCAEESDEKICEILRKYQIPIFCVILKEDECFIDEIMQNLQFTTPQIQQINPLKIQNDDENEREKLKELIQKSCNLLPQSQRAVFATRQQCDKELEKSTMKESAKSIIDNYVNMAMASAEVPFAELPTQCAMIIHINKIYGIELCSENIVNIIVGFGSVAGVKGLMVYAQVPQNNSTNALLVKITTPLLAHFYITFLDKNFNQNIKELIAKINVESLKELLGKEKLLSKINFAKLGLDKVNLEKLTNPFAKSIPAFSFFKKIKNNKGENYGISEN